MKEEEYKSVAIIVAHPDEETLWAGGTILSHPMWKCFVVCLTNANNLELAPRFFNALKLLKSEGVMGQLDEVAENIAASDSLLESEITHLLPNTHFDLLITHSSLAKSDNYVQQQVNKAVVKLLDKGIIDADELWTFATEDGKMECLSGFPEKLNVKQVLTKNILRKKYNIITRIFGLNSKVLDIKTEPAAEAFWQHKYSFNFKNDFNQYGHSLTIFRAPTIEALKFIYNKSKSVVTDIDNWLLKDAPYLEDESIDYLSKNNASYKYFGKDLKIFQKSTIENLKTRYYENLSYLFDRNFWKSTNEREDSSRIDVFKLSKKTMCRAKSLELSIFKAPSIDNLKSLYNRSVWPLINKGVNETDNVTGNDELSGYTNLKNTSELRIFKYLSVDTLKSLYYGNIQ